MIIDLTPDSQAIIKRFMDTGLYLDESDVIRAAIRNMIATEPARQLQRARAERLAKLEHDDIEGTASSNSATEED